MRGAWKLGSVAGIAVQVHWTFLLLLAWVALASGLGDGAGAAARGVAFLALLFVTIALHELGHALAARRFGVRTLDITLLPIGGVARLERFPEGAVEGLVIALAGPAVSAAIGAALLGGALLVGGRALVHLHEGSPLLVQLGWANVALFLFNLLPAYPMDGGRALRAGLVPWCGQLGATRYAASVGRAMAVVFGVVGLLVNPMLVLIALFVWVQASAEEQEALVRHALGGRTVGDALARDVRALPADARVADAAGLLSHGLQQDFPVVDDRGRLVGLVSQVDLVRALAGGQREALLGEVMARGPAPIALDSSLATAYARLLEAAALGHRALPVVDGEALVGLVGLDTVAALLAVDGAAADEPAAPPAPASPALPAAGGPA